MTEKIQNRIKYRNVGTTRKTSIEVIKSHITSECTTQELMA